MSFKKLIILDFVFSLVSLAIAFLIFYLFDL